MKRMVCTFGELTVREQAVAGGKGGTLARLYQAGYPVPEGFAILPVAFVDDELSPEAWGRVQEHLARLRRGDPHVAFAVRSSALGEDSARASFAGAFDTVLDVCGDEEVRQAIHAVRCSRHGSRVQAYSQVQGLTATHEMAVIVQRLVRANVSGVLFTADPLTGSRARMVGNSVCGLGEKLVSGEADAQAFTLERPHGQFKGPSELGRFARTLYRLGIRLEEALGCPQDVEWAIAGRRLYLLQSRPVTTLQAYNPATGEWNHSLAGDFLWTNSNFCEAVCDVMTPATWSMWEIFLEAVSFEVPGYPLVGAIGGRPYINMSLLLSFGWVLGIDEWTMRKRSEDLWGRIPDGVDVPLVPLSRWQLLRLMLPTFLWMRRALCVGKGEIQAFIATCPRWCDTMRQQICQTRSPADLADLWRRELRPYFGHAWRIGRAALESSLIGRLRRDLVHLVGTADANALLSNLSGSQHLASLGPLVSLSKVARGEMSREAYLRGYGHRGAHEMEVSMPRPAEDPEWLDRQLAAFARSPVDVEMLLQKQRTAFDNAWRRFEKRYPRKVRSVRQRIERVAASARLREAARSEATRVIWVIRAFVLRVGELVGIENGDDVFFMSLDEMLDVLSGNKAALAFIPTRRETHVRYSALPPYPAIIRGRFDPFAWAADPQRRSDVFDSRSPTAAGWLSSASDPDTITGFAGAAGTVEGPVRRLDSPEEGDQLRPGEILVTATTNVGWTLLFPRVAAIVTDVGAPLSHAAIVARELGIPAVVGCGNATMYLHTGDRVQVNGGQGVVRILQGTKES
jgi:phosphohistidine swiveling domain-containing protein